MKRVLNKICQQFSTLHPDHKRIIRGASWVALFVLIGKLAGAAKEMAIAYRYGVSNIVDAYQLSFTVVTWLPGTLISVMNMVLIPVLVRLRHNNSEKRTQFLAELHGATLMLGMLFTLLGLTLGPKVVVYLAANLSVETQQMTRHMILGMSPAALLILTIGVYSARLQAQEKQVNTLLESIPAAIILGFILFWPIGAEVAPLLCGILFGYSIQTIWLGNLAHQADGEKTRPRWSWASPYWSEIYQAMSVMAIGQYVMSLITPIDQYFAAQLGDNAIATLSYASRIIALLLGLGSMAIARATLPVLSSIAALGDLQRARSVALKWSCLMLFIGVIVIGIGWYVAPWIVRLLFERGAFTSENTQAVTFVLRWGLVQVPFSFASLVLVQFLASLGFYWIISLIATTNLFTKTLMNFLLVPMLGISGIALAFGIMSSIGFVLFFTISYFSPKLTRPVKKNH